MEITYEIKSENGKKYRKTDKLKSEHTLFTKLLQPVQDKIKADIAEKRGISVEQVDLSKLAHLRTTLTIERHPLLDARQWLYSL